MPRGLVALFALLEALFVIGLGILVPFALGLIGWATLSGIHTTPIGVWQVAVQSWALGHGVPLRVTLGTSSTVLSDSLASFTLSVAPWGFALVTALMGRRAGRRLAGSTDATLVVGLLVLFVGLLAGVALSSASSATVTLDPVLGAIRVLVPFVVGLVVGWAPWKSDSGSTFALPEIPVNWRDVADVAARVAGATLAALVAIASLGIVGLIVAGFATEVALYESLHTGIWGGLIVTIGQLTFAPVLLVWMMAWIVGPGFALGAGSLVSPFAATVGAVPAIPLLGAIPQTATVGWWITLIPGVIAAIASARLSDRVVLRHRLLDFVDASDSIRLATAATGAAVFAAVVTILVGTYATGSAGPGRFAHVGIDPLMVGGVLAGGVFLGSLVGLFLGTVARETRALS